MSKCPYCDFNSHVRDRIDTAVWEKGLIEDLKSFLPSTVSKTVTSIFFGGGTPSLMPPSMVENILLFIHQNWSIDKAVEITLEANPNSTEINKLKDFSKAGINRISLGVQSLEDDALKFLKRGHTALEARRAIDMAQKVFPRYSFDLIYSRPHQTLDAWGKELHEGLKLAQGHLSLYQLTIEEGTPFYLAYHRGDFPMPDEEKSADFYEYTNKVLAAHGYETYEISNYAQPGQECAHNLVYWRYQDYIGVGPGAHSRVSDPVTQRKWAIRRHRSPEYWLENGGNHEQILLSEEDLFQEILLMGLRLKEGVHKKVLNFYCPRLSSTFLTSDKLKALAEQGLLLHLPDRLQLTPAGQLRMNSVWNYLIQKRAL